MSSNSKWQKENEEYINGLQSEIAETFLNEVKALTPVKTGHLRAGWKKDNNTVYNDVDYLGYVNEGTRYIKPRRFIEAAFQRTIDAIGRDT